MKPVPLPPYSPEAILNFNGIAGKNIYDFDKEKEVSVLYDPDYIGNYTKEHYSPRKLISSTIGDELKIASKGRSDVYAIAPNPESAILSAGHAANGAFWMAITTANGQQRPTTKGFLGMWTATTTARNLCRHVWSR